MATNAVPNSLLKTKHLAGKGGQKSGVAKKPVLVRPEQSRGQPQGPNLLVVPSSCKNEWGVPVQIMRCAGKPQIGRDYRIDLKKTFEGFDVHIEWIET